MQRKETMAYLYFLRERERYFNFKYTFSTSYSLLHFNPVQVPPFHLSPFRFISVSLQADSSSSLTFNLLSYDLMPKEFYFSELCICHKI